MSRLLFAALSAMASLCAAPQQPAADAPAPTATTVTLRGRVVAWDGKPLPGAAVALALPQAMTTAELLASPPQRAGADGSFAFVVPAVPEPGVRPQLLIAHPGMASVARSPRWDYVPQKAAAGKPAPQRLRDTDLGEVVLPEGARLFGRVRGADGQPLAGALVVARDLLDSHRTLQGQSFGCSCRARTDAQGIFQLGHTLPNAVAIEVSLDGYYRHEQEPVAIGTPLEITLQKSGWIAGRVLDADGRGVGKATVTAAYEWRGQTEPVRSDADGSFRLPCARAGRYRLTAAHTEGNRTTTQTSDVLQGPRDNLELTLPKEPPAEEQTQEQVVVKAVRKQGNEPVAEFRATAVFEEYANRNNNYLEYRLSERWGNWSDASGGEAKLPPPQQGQPQTGVVRVLAAGCAPATRRDFEWKDVEAGKTREPLVVELIPESALEGKVVDETTGAPIAGAAVWALPRPDPNGGFYGGNDNEVPKQAVRSGADGAFVLPQLGEGSWQIRCVHPKRPRQPPIDIDLKAEQRLTGFVVKLPAGAVVEGRITGMPIPQGARVFLQDLPRFSFTGGGNYMRYLGSNGVPDSAVPVASDGAFAFQGVKLDSFQLMLALPSPPRCGGIVMLPLEPFRVRKDGIRRDFAAGEDQPGTIRGTLKFPRAGVPFEQVVVASFPTAEEQGFNLYPGMQWPGPRSFVAADGGFSLRVGPGTHRLGLIDLATGVLLAFTPADVRVRAGETVTSDLAAQLTAVHVQLVPEDAKPPLALVDRVEVRFQLKLGQNQGGFAGENYEQCASLMLQPGQRELLLALPVGNGILLARNNVSAVRIDNERNNQGPLGRLELEISGTETAPIETQLKIGPPPEIPDPKAKAGEEKGEDADEDGVAPAKQQLKVQVKKKE